MYACQTLEAVIKYHKQKPPLYCNFGSWLFFLAKGEWTKMNIMYKTIIDLSPMSLKNSLELSF